MDKRHGFTMTMTSLDLSLSTHQVEKNNILSVAENEKKVAINNFINSIFKTSFLYKEKRYLLTNHMR